MEITLGVDALEPQLGGIGRYTWELCKGLPRAPQVSSIHYYGRGRLLDDPARLITGEALPKRNRFLGPLQCRAERKILSNSLFHGPNYFLPRSIASGIITVHDLSVFRFPETHPADRLAQFERDFTDSVARARHIITDTETIREDLIAFLGCPADFVSAVHLGVGKRFHPSTQGELQAFRARAGIAEAPYALCVSHLEPRKKLIELLRIWAELPHRLQSAFPLVIAGGSGWVNDEIAAAVDLGERQGWLKHLGFVPEDDLPRLYAGASVFIYPSIYEGFGLPPLEAMACGVPVVVSDRTCLTEVCGDAACYIDPDNHQNFLDTIRNLLEDPELRRHKAAAGLARARMFDWDQCALKTALVYEAVAKS